MKLKSNIHLDYTRRNNVEIPKEEWQKVLKESQNAKVKNEKGRVIGEVISCGIKEGQLQTIVDVENDPRYVGLIPKPEVEFTPICSECGKDFRDCNHWFDKAFIVAKDVKLKEIKLVPKDG